MYTYIVIDDEELIRKGTIKKLEPMSDRITCIGEASEGGEGLELISRLHPDFVILDMQMPGINGLELLPALADKYPDLPLIVISGYRNFDYIKQAISSNALEYVLKPFSREAIQEVVLKALEKLENRTHMYDQIKISEQEKEQVQYDYDIQLIKNLLLGYQTNTTELTSQKLTYICENHDLCLLAVETPQALSESTILPILQEFGFEDLVLFFSSPASENLGLLLLFVPCHGSTAGHRMAEQILHDIVPQLNEQGRGVRVGISQIHHSISELKQTYAEAVSALNRQLLDDNAPEYYFYEQEEAPFPISWEKEDELLFRIETGMENEVARLTEELFLYYKTIPGCTLADVKYHCYMLSDQCRKILDEYIHTSDSLKTSASMQNVVNNLFSLHDLFIYHRQFFLNLAKMIRPNSVYAIDDVIEKVQIYLQKNYQKNISQEYLSSLFYINRSYLSTLFRERTGQKFVDYLNHVRIAKSLELLSGTDRKMYQIARSVGYDNVKYFFRIFKKIMKMTPEEYRLSHSEN